MRYIFNKLDYHYRIIKRYGLSGFYFLASSKFKKNKTSGIILDGVKTPVTLSNFGPDAQTLLQIFYGLEYNISLKESPNFIIDCGANIGLSALYFANKYPKATILALEPDLTNFHFLKLNCSLYQNIICLNKAVWSHPTKLEMKDNNLGNWGLSTIELENGVGSVDAISIEMLMSEFNIDVIDLLKIDIEGAEKDLFSINYKHWLPKTKTIAIELHDKADNIVSDTFYNAIEIFPHRLYQLGENIICHFDH